jgi:hypothetical protein
VFSASFFTHAEHPYSAQSLLITCLSDTGGGAALAPTDQDIEKLLGGIGSAGANFQAFSVQALFAPG